MKVKLPIKIHNKFEVEVKDVTTGEVVSKGYAENILPKVVSKGYGENILLNGIFNKAWVTTPWNNCIIYGSGEGTLSPARTSLFARVGGKTASIIEAVYGQIPTINYCTKMVVITPSEHVGVVFKEVGFGENTTTPLSHALIKDSEGNPLALGPKTDTQEITIYGTTFAEITAENGFLLAHPEVGYQGVPNNALIRAFIGYGEPKLTGWSSYRAGYYVNGGGTKLGALEFSIIENGKLKTPIHRFQTNQGNTKIKTLLFSAYETGYYIYPSFINVNPETLAENNSTVWSGWEFDHTPVGTGDGTTKTFNLPWDEVWEGKPKTVYVDGVAVSSGVTWASDSITFDTAPADQAIITADYWVKYIPKDSDHVLDVQFELNLSEGSPV